MEIYPKDFCIFVASHISKQKRINLLLQCLHSLIKQNMVICIYEDLALLITTYEDYTNVNSSLVFNIADIMFEKIHNGNEE